MNLKELYLVSKQELEKLLDSELNDFRLEQAVFNQAENYWDVVVSYLVENKNQPEKQNILTAFNYNLPFERIFKVFHISNEKTILGFYRFTPAA